jgi:hypothetical protein
MWAVAEITWEGDSGTSFRVPAVLEDTSRSGACVRLKRPLALGSRITIQWHREQFPAIARNCRTDGGDFLLGVRREAEIVSATKSASHPAAPDAEAERTLENPAAMHATPTQIASPTPVRRIETAPAGVKPTPGLSRKPFRNAVAMAPPRLRTEIHTRGHLPISANLRRFLPNCPLTSATSCCASGRTLVHQKGRARVECGLS